MAAGVAVAAAGSEPGSRSGTAAALRQAILLLYLLGAIGVTAELLLLGHVEDAPQLVPFVVLGLGTMALAVAAARPGRGVLRVAQAAMILLAGAGVLGLWFHYAGNVAFEREAYPDRRGFRLVWEAVTGATPALAPGLLAHLGLIGLAYTYRHPSLERHGSTHPDGKDGPC